MLKEEDNKKYVTLYGVYVNARPYLEKQCKKYGYKTPKYETFSKVIRTFFNECINAAIYEYKTITLPYRYGTIGGVKTLCVNRNPVKVYWLRENGKNVKHTEKLDINSFDGYWYSVIWNFPKNLQMYKFTLSKTWKKKLFFNVLDGGDYPIRE